MSADAPKVQDFTTAEQTLSVAVEASSVYETLLSLFVWGNKDESGEYESGSTFFEQLEADVKESAADELAAMVGAGEIWLPLIGLAHSTGEMGSMTRFIEHLEVMDVVALRQIMIGGACAHYDLSQEDADAAAASDPDAIERVVALKHVSAGLESLIRVPARETRSRVVALLTAVNEALGASISESLPALRRDADEKRALARSKDAPKLVETATNGVTFKPQPHITGVVLIPSKIIRPWTVIIEHEGLRIFAYSVADEHLLADPDAPPSYLVDLYKALGDERRLRMLSILSEGDAGLMDIAERVDLAKSTTHHHLRILRSAGLVRVTVGENKSYSLRRDGVPEAARLLEAYLTTPAEASSATTPEPARS
ncbi:MAG: winged helix-turn-helix transcriptional regulator [bacterium]|nr:winged helix-turn-helix transcriptional regulator [bacterium]MCP4966563.1 winged helix-turn-helix transcriptional regulator [bacterium]